jgi:ACT domain-containing protein
VTPKGKLSNTFAKKIVIVKNMKELLLDSTPKTMEAKDIIQKTGEKTITDTNIKVHHILGILRFNFTVPLLFGFFF